MASPLLLPDEEEKAEETPTLSGLPRTVEATQQAMGPTPSAVQPKMRQKMQAGLQLKRGPSSGLLLGDKPVDSMSGRTGRAQLKLKRGNTSEVYDPTPQDPLVSKLSTTDDAGTKPSDIVNFLFGNEMGIVGAKWDNEGFS